jgi:hypothetical protein
MLKLAAVAAVALLLAACAASENPDSRAFSSSDSRFDLKESLSAADVVLPPSARKVKFGYYVALQGEGLDLRFTFDCDDLDVFLQESRVPESALQPHEVPPMVGTAISDHDWTVDEQNLRGGQQDWFSGSGARDFAVETVGEGKCLGYVSTTR